MLRLIIILTAVALVQSQSCSVDCRLNGNYQNPNDKHSYIQCTNGKAVLIACPVSGDGYNRLKFDGEICRETYVCPQLDGMFPHPHKDLYWRCVNGVSSIERCSTGEVFSGHYRCIQKFDCPDLSGSFAHPGNRSEYYKCCFGEAQLYFCPAGYLYEQGSDCVPVFQCPQLNGKYRNLRKESQYYNCIDGKPILESCPPKHIFDGLECVEKFECPLSNGKFINRQDKTNRTYYVCDNNKAIRMTCPGTHVFYGQECEELFRCPQPDGRFANPKDQHKYYMCEKNIPYPHQCPQDQEFSDYRQECKKPFQCPSSSGRYRHPENRTKFYECDNSVPKIRYCPLGRVFDGSQCVREGNGFQCPGVGTHKHPTEKSKYYYCGEDLLPKLQECALGYVYNELTMTCVRSQFQCPQTDGRFAHPHSDRHYFECRGGSAQLLSCPQEQRFDEYTRVCTGIKPDYNCLQTDGLFSHPTNLSLFYHCLGGVAHLRHCGLGKIFDQNIQNCIARSTGYQCPRSNGRFPYHDDERRYYQCQDNIPHIRDCATGQRFNPSLDACDGNGDQQDYLCPEPDGMFRHSSNQSLFYYCQGGVAQLRYCGPNKIFEESLRNCMNADFETYRCPQPDGSFPHPSNRRQYYLCHRNIWQIVTCPTEQLFDAHRARCVGSSTGGYECPAPDGLFKHQTNQSRFYYCRNYHAELRECLFHHIFDQEVGQCIPWSWPSSFYCPLPNGLFINPQNNSQYYECCQGRPTLRSCPDSQIFNGRHCMSEVVYSCESASNSNHPAHPVHCYNGHRYQYSCPYMYGTELVYNGYRCVEPYHCPNDRGNYVIKNRAHSHQYIRCANGMPSLYTCSRGFTYDDRRGCCVFDEHQMSGYFGYKVDDRTDPKPIDDRVNDSTNQIPGVIVVKPIDANGQGRFTIEPNRFHTERTPGLVVFKPLDRDDDEQDRLRLTQPNRVTMEPDRIYTNKIPTLPVNEPVEIRHEYDRVKPEKQTKPPSINDEDYKDDDDDGLDDDYKEEDYKDDEDDNDEEEKFRRSIRDWQINKLI